jgi:predicted transcriptional regulator
MFSIIDYREEFFVRLYRCWLIVSILGFNRKGEKILSIQKAAFFDFLVRNPKSFHEFLVKFERLSEETHYKDILYSSNIGYGAFQDYQDFLKSVLVLESEGYLEITREGDDFLVASTNKKFTEVMIETPSWQINIRLLKPLVSKSLSVLYKGVLSK